MPRAIGVFRKAGFPVEPYPVDYRIHRVEAGPPLFVTMRDGLWRTDTAMHEWVGLAVYWLTGRSSELFPAPTRNDRKKQGCARPRSIYGRSATTSRRR